MNKANYVAAIFSLCLYAWADLPYMSNNNGVLIPDDPSRKGTVTGLQRAFPEIIGQQQNPTTPQKVALGKLLFFDPLLSGDNTMSCAHCHHPDLGFSDGLPRSRGKASLGIGQQRSGGLELPRSAPTLWNSLYNHRQFWDGRAKDLEEQAKGPITDPGEMAENPDNLVKELQAISRYQQLFAQAFPEASDQAITFDNVAKAIAAFERTLLSFGSRYDRYAAGEPNALSASEKRGLTLFLSTKLRCNECHGIPTFADPEFKVIGVPDPTDGPADTHKPSAKPGLGGGPNGAFKVPTLRNIALSAPYMHNGTLATLSDVLDFYANGGGKGRGLDVPLQDDKIRKFHLSSQEKEDVIAFLHSLTDISALPEFPSEVPSGLPIIGRIANNVINTSVAPVMTGDAPVSVVEVRPGQSIQAAVEKLRNGGTVKIYPGIYREKVFVIFHNISLQGVTERGERPIIDGENMQADGVIAMADNFTIENITLRHFQGNGIVVQEAKNVTFRNLITSDTGLYGVYPIECTGVVVENCKVSGARDAGIYVGQSRDIVVRDNEVFHSVTGIEIENSVNALVENNYVHNNTGGILVFLLPFNPSKVASHTKVTRNRVFYNNHPNFADENAIVRNVMQGTGIMVMAADYTEVTENVVIGNDTFGISVCSLYSVYPKETPLDVDPLPEHNTVYNNQIKDNAQTPDPRMAKFGIPARELMWDGSGTNNTWQETVPSFPPELPKK